MPTYRGYQILKDIGDRFGPARRGKIVQRALELAFGRRGFRLTEERLVEGIDADFENRADPSDKLTIEIRSTEGDAVPVREEDLRQLDAQARNGFKGVLAALRVAPGTRWVLVGRAWLKVGKLRVSISTTTGWEELADAVDQAFERVLIDHRAKILERGLNAMEPELMEAMADTAFPGRSRSGAKEQPGYTGSGPASAR